MIDSFGLRLGLVMALALLPVGVLGVLQAVDLVDAARSRSEAALAGETLRAVRPQLSRLQQAQGAVAVLAGMDQATCTPALTDRDTPLADVAFAAIYDAQGRRLCGTDDSPRLMAPPVRDRAGDASPLVQLVRLTPRRSVVIATQRLTRSDGFAVVAPTEGAAEGAAAPDWAAHDFSLVLFDPRGEVLTISPIPPHDAPSLLPRAPALAMLATSAVTSFSAPTEAGSQRAYSVVTLIDGRLFALGSWPVAEATLGDFGPLPVAIIPALMWAISLIAAWIAAETLVTTHIRRLRTAITAFAGGNRKVQNLDLRRAPPEIRDTALAFEAMTQTILQDEARLEDSLRHSETLLREVHHRVKNNLQLIASILNIQMRRTRSPDVQRALGSLQDRLLGLATVHDRIYQASDLSEIAVHRLFPGIVDQMLRRSGGREREFRVETSFDALALTLDKAVPLALLMTEAVSNAVRYAQTTDGTPPVLRVVFQRIGAHEVHLEVVNSAQGGLGTTITGDTGGGIGTQLLRGFVRQLAGTFQREFSDGLCRVTVRFSVEAATNPI